VLAAVSLPALLAGGAAALGVVLSGDARSRNVASRLNLVTRSSANRSNADEHRAPYRESSRRSVYLAAAAAVVVAGAALHALGALAATAAGSAAAFAVLRRRNARLSAASRPHPSRDPVRSVGTEIPAAIDLLAACLSAGATPERALASVADAFDGDIADVLSTAARLSALGAPVETAWSRYLGDARWGPVARSVIRAHHSGAALTDVLVRLADDRRHALRAEAHAGSQRAGVHAVLPLGLCFLPAFVLVGVVPVVAGFAHALWG
jgi:pilus assembly protein TadC